MNYPSFCYGSYESQSPMADLERTVNWAPEPIEAPGGMTDYALYPTPGQMPFIVTTDVGTRAFGTASDREFAVIGSGFYELFATGTATRWGTVTQDNYPATISYNGKAGGHVFITSGGNGYCFVLATNTLSQVLTGTATMGGMVDEYFLSFDIVTGRVFFSALNDGTSWDPSDFFARTIAPDPWQAMVIRDREIVLIGTKTGEVWIDAGTSPVPWAPIPGAVFNEGTGSPFAVAVAGETVTWVSQNGSGSGRVVAMREYIPQRISNYAIEQQLSRSSLTNAELLVYQDQGHPYTCVNFPSAPATHVYDGQTQLWHGRNSNRENTAGIWSPRVHGYAFGRHLVGNRTSGTIYEMDIRFGTEADGGPIRRKRIGPPMAPSGSAGRLTVSRFTVRLDAGLGLVTGQGSDPTVMFRISTDGRVFRNERTASAGAIGQYSTRVFWNRCGSSQTVWVPEITVSDPIPWRCTGADIEGDGFASRRQAA